MSFRTSRLAALGLFLVLPAAVHGQEASIVLRENDVVPNAGFPIRALVKLAVNDSGLVFSEVLLDGASGDANFAILRGRLAHVIEGTPLAAPLGSVLERADHIDVNEAGSLGWPVEFRGTDVTPTDDVGIFWNASLLAREGDPIFASTIHGTPLPAGTRYQRLNTAKINNRDTILFAGQLDLDTIAGTEAVLALLRTDGQGNVIDEELLFLESFDEPRTGEPVRQVNTSIDGIALANDGSYMAQLKVGMDFSDNSRDSLIVLNDQVLAREGDPAPLPPDPVSGAARHYVDLGATKVGLNDFGDYAFTGYCDGDTATNVFLVVNGRTVIQEGDTLPAFGGKAFARFDSVAVKVSNSGDVYWYAKTDGPTAEDQYLMRNDQAILQENVSTVDGETVTGIGSVLYSFDVSDSGRFWVAEVRDEENDEMLVLADFGASYPLLGCTGNPGSLTKTSGEARVGETLHLEMDGEQAPGTLPLLFLSSASAVPGNLRDTQQCGVGRSFGELMIDLSPGALFYRIAAPATDGSPVALDLAIPSDLYLVDLQIYAQGAYYDAAGVSSTPLQLTNGFYVEVGAP